MMTIIEALVMTLVVFVAVGGVIFVPILAGGLIDNLIESVRKNKHPEYFEYYDTAIAECFRVGGKFNAEKKRIEYYLKLYSDSYKDGECTRESFEKKMGELARYYVEACDTFNQEHSNIKVLWQKADNYAKEHNLKWGIIYDT